VQFFFDKEKNLSIDFFELIARACEGWLYISETDAPVAVFVEGRVNDVNVETARVIANAAEGGPIRRGFHAFFARLT
jgi:hypothetical protein